MKHVHIVNVSLYRQINKNQKSDAVHQIIFYFLYFYTL